MPGILALGIHAMLKLDEDAYPQFVFYGVAAAPWRLRSGGRLSAERFSSLQPNNPPY